MEFTKKAQERDNSRIFKSIEDTAHMLELQAAYERQRLASEIARVSRERQRLEQAKVKAKQLQEKDLERVKIMHEKMEEERRRSYDQMLKDVEVRRERRRQEEEKEKTRLDFEKQERDSTVLPHEPYIVSVEEAQGGVRYLHGSEPAREGTQGCSPSHAFRDKRRISAYRRNGCSGSC